MSARVEVACPYCDQKLRLPAGLAGRARCPNPSCGHSFRADTTAPAPPPPRTSPRTSTRPSPSAAPQSAPADDAKSGFIFLAVVAVIIVVLFATGIVQVAGRGGCEPLPFDLVLGGYCVAASFGASAGLTIVMTLATLIVGVVFAFVVGVVRRLLGGGP